MDGSSVYKRVTTVPDLSFQFCMKLPQSIYDVAADTTNIITTPILLTPTFAIVRSLNYYFSTTGIDVTVQQSTPPTSSSSTANFPSPAMQLFMFSYNTLLHTTKGYYGGTIFLDNQEEFKLTFGFSPAILPSNPMSTNYLLTHKLQRKNGEK